jgi:hypothetical protein
MLCAFWTRAHAAEYVNEIGQAVQAAGGQTAPHVVDRPAPSAQTPGTRPRAQASGLVGRRLTQPTHPREAGLFAEARNAHAVPDPIWEAGWPIGSGSVESANKGVVEARLKGPGMRWGRQNVNPMLVLRNAVCNRQWNETWRTSVAQRQALRTHRRQAARKPRLTCAFWMLVFWGARVSRLSHPPVPASPSMTAEALVEQPTRRLGAGYSWRKPFLRRPPSAPTVPGEACAKK